MIRLVSVGAVAAFAIGMASAALAVTDQQMQMMKRCMAIESAKSNDTRGGLSASEFCAALVVIETNS